jgi:hypothetical protein
VPSSSCTPGGNLASGGGTPDPRTAIVWKRIFWCPTAGGAIVYLNVSSGKPIDFMDNSKSIWVVCWVRGQNSRVWYYTQGDRPLPGDGTSLDGWGFIHADALLVRHQPDPAVLACPSSVPAA